MSQNLDFWKQTQDNKGSAALFNTTEKGYTFVKMMPQSGEKSFDFKSNINVALGEFDMGAMIAVLERRVKGLGKYNSEKNQFGGLVHNPDDGVYSFVNMSWIDDSRLIFGLSYSNKAEGVNRQYRMGLTDGEQMALLEFLRAALRERFAANAVRNAERLSNNGGDGGGNSEPAPKRSSAPVTSPAPTSAPKRPTAGANAKTTKPQPRVEVVEETEDNEVPI